MEENLQRQERKDLRRKLLKKKAEEDKINDEKLRVMVELLKAQKSIHQTQAGKIARKLIDGLVSKIDSEINNDTAKDIIYMSFGTEEREAKAKELMKSLGWKKSPIDHVASMLPAYHRNKFIKNMKIKHKIEKNK